LWLCAPFMLFNGALALSLKALLVWEKKRLDSKYGPVRTQKADEASAGEGNSESRFRYIL